MQAKTAQQLRQRVVELHRRLKETGLDPTAAAEIATERKKVSANLQVAAYESRTREERIARREKILIRIVWPFIVTDNGLFHRAGSVQSSVSRGANHQPMDDTVSDQVKAIPSERNHLLQAYLAAIDFHNEKDARYRKLVRRYHRDLEAHLDGKADPQQARLEFDRQFYRDRAQAMHEIKLAEEQVKKLTKRMQVEGQRRLEDMESNYGSISSDGRTDSLGTFFMRNVGRQERLDQPYILDYLQRVDQDHLVDPSQWVTGQKEDSDCAWEARSVVVGDFDTLSRAEDLRTRERILRWREEGEQIRAQLRDQVSG